MSSVEALRVFSLFAIFREKLMSKYWSRLLKRTITMILAGGKGERLYPLTKARSKPAVPFGGLYRIMDFTLSNCVNSGFRRIYCLTQYKSQSLDEHLRMGWNIFSHELDEFLYSVPAQQQYHERWYQGTADAIFQNVNLLGNAPTDYVLILSGDHIYKMDYSKMLDFHLERGADLTISTIEIPKAEAARFGVCVVDENSKVVEFREKDPEAPEIPGKPGRCMGSMGIYIFNTHPLVREISQDARKNTAHDFGKNIIPGMLKDYKVFAYPFSDENRKETSYWQDIGTIDSYYAASMDLVSINPLFDLYDMEWPVRTYFPPAPPSKTVWTSSDRMGSVLQSLICHGSIVSGGKVFQSILGPRVKVNSYSDVENSILFGGVNVGRRTKIRKAIIDKDVVIPEGVSIGYDAVADRKNFVVSDGGVVVVPKGYRWD